MNQSPHPPRPSPARSRLAGRRIVFQPYNKDQLVTIMKSRLGELGCGNVVLFERFNVKIFKSERRRAPTFIV